MSVKNSASKIMGGSDEQDFETKKVEEIRLRKEL